LKEDKVKLRSHSYISTPKLNPKISKNGIKLLFERTQNSDIQQTRGGSKNPEIKMKKAEI
jgi:hypothetical protein